MSKLKNLQWIPYSAFHGGLLYMAFWQEREGALHLLKFLCWCIALVSLFALSDEAMARASKLPPANVLKRAVVWSLSALTLLCLVWYGHPVTGAAWACAMLILNAVAKERRASEGVEK